MITSLQYAPVCVHDDDKEAALIVDVGDIDQVQNNDQSDVTTIKYVEATDADSTAEVDSRKVSGNVQVSGSAASLSSVQVLLLVLFCLQNAASIMTTRYSRSVLHQTYSAQCLVVVMELVKTVFSVLMLFCEGETLTSMSSLLWRSGRMMIPSLIYVAQNNFQLIALKYLSASTFSVISQTRILFTAACSVVMLGAVITGRQLCALVFLAFGAIIVVWTSTSSSFASNKPVETTANVEMNIYGYIIDVPADVFGTAAALLMTLLGGFVNVYIEFILKFPVSADEQQQQQPPSIWQRNLQLSVWGMLISFITALMIQPLHAQQISFNTLFPLWLFDGFTWFTWLVVLLQSVGGILVSIVLKTTSNIIKIFVQCISLILITILSVYSFNESLNQYFAIGSIVIAVSTFDYFKIDPLPAVER